VLHEPGTVRLLGRVLVVRRALELQIRDRRLSASSHRDDVVEL
jgi:hypothetical protein